MDRPYRFGCGLALLALCTGGGGAAAQAGGGAAAPDGIDAAVWRWSGAAGLEAGSDFALESVAVRVAVERPFTDWLEPGLEVGGGLDVPRTGTGLTPWIGLRNRVWLAPDGSVHLLGVVGAQGGDFIPLLELGGGFTAFRAGAWDVALGVRLRLDPATQLLLLTVRPPRAGR